MQVLIADDSGNVIATFDADDAIDVRDALQMALFAAGFQDAR